MSRNTFFKIALLCIALNCLLFPFINQYYFITVVARIVFCALIGIYFGYHTKYDAFYQKHIKFCLYICILVIFWLIYESHNMECDILNTYTGIYYLFTQKIIIDNYSLPFSFIFDSFITSFSVLSYIILYFMYHVTSMMLHNSTTKNSKKIQKYY